MNSIWNHGTSILEILFSFIISPVSIRQGIHKNYSQKSFTRIQDKKRIILFPSVKLPFTNSLSSIFVKTLSPQQAAGLKQSYWEDTNIEEERAGYGKITIRMKTPPVLTDSHPPKLFQALLGGFNIVANNISLIVLPVVLDLVLWLGPKFKLQSLLSPKLSSITAATLQMSAADAATTLATTQKMLAQTLSQFNLSILIRTIPVGIPSLISREAIIGSPLGKGMEYQLTSFGQTFLILAALLLVGYFLGNFYFNMLARFTAKPIEKINLKKLIFQFGQSLVMALILVVLLLMISAPILMILWAISLISGGIADFILLVAIFILLWMIMPLVFSPHGVYVINQRAFPSMLLSLRMVRFFLPGTGMFVVTAALLSEVMNMVWTIPDPTTWLTLIGILGHAFVVTALLTASFIYYREGLRWMQETIQHMSTPMNKLENGGPLGTTRQ